MKPGPQLNLQVAERCFKIRVETIKGKPTDVSSKGNSQWATIRSYSTVDQDAWVLVDLYRFTYDYSFKMERRGKKKVLAVFAGNGKSFKSFGETIPHAICLAGLKVSDYLREKGIDVDPIVC